jgi:hypothetical protein
LQGVNPLVYQDRRDALVRCVACNYRFARVQGNHYCLFSFIQAETSVLVFVNLFSADGSQHEINRKTVASMLQAKLLDLMLIRGVLTGHQANTVMTVILTLHLSSISPSIA